FSPSGTLKWFWDPLGYLYASVGEGFRPPVFDELYHPNINYLASGQPLPAGFGNGESGNPDLSPERSESNEVGAAWEGARLTAKVAGYANLIHDYISNQIDPSDGYWTYLNFPHVRILGGETNLDWRLLPWIKPYASYTYQDVRDTDTDSPIVGVLRQKLVGGLVLSLGGLSVDFNAKIVDRNAIRLPDNNALNDPGETAPFAPDAPYTTLNAMLKTRWGEGVQAYASVQNMLNTPYSVLPGIPMEGIYFESGVTKKF
ncbi:MAG: TonB-dependent receptor domain-containing protein, partial [bacterium]